MSTIETDTMKMIRSHLYVEMGNLQGLIQTISAAGNLSDDQEGLCREVCPRLGYLRQVVTESGPDVVSGPTT